MKRIGELLAPAVERIIAMSPVVGPPRMSGALRDRVRREVFERDLGLCRYCGREVRRAIVSRRAGGIVDTADNVVASRTELDCFRALGLDWKEPAEREAPELDHLVRSEA